jgi:hypothetical protein
MIELEMYPGPPKRKKRPGATGRFQRIPRQLALAYGRSGTKTIIEQADDFAFCYAPYIQAAVREVGNNYHQVARWLVRERIPSQRNGRWAAQSVKNLVNRYERLTGKLILVPYKTFPTPARRKGAPREPQLLPWDQRRPGHRVRIRGFHWL